MAATQKPAPKKSSGFQGVRNAFWIIAAMFVVAVCIFKFVLGNPANFVGGDPEGEVLNGNMLGTIYKGGIVVPVLITLMLTVLCLSIERLLAQKTAFGKMSTTKFVVAISLRLRTSATSSVVQSLTLLVHLSRLTRKLRLFRV